ncbi:MAG: amidase [Rhodospirillales bacterium]|nr:amidase [Rhodospirillales bacterium]
MPATQLAAEIRAGRLSAREAVASTLARIGAVNPIINALPDVMAEEALKAAATADEAQARGERIGPMHGVPVTIKVNVDVKGRATTNGIVALRDNIAAENAPVVDNLRAAGAIVVGRSNTPAFSYRWFTDNDLHGRTLNPWDHAITPGGSSGGAAAATATGMGAIGHGNDIGGSVRYPAYACGIAGLRPTAGRIPAHNATMADDRALSSQMMSVQGPLARSIADLRLAFTAMARPDPRDPISLPMAFEFPLPATPIKVALFRDARADSQVAGALDRAARALAGAGFVVEEAAPPNFDEAHRIWLSFIASDMRRSMLPAIETYGDAAIRASARHFTGSVPELSCDDCLALLARRYTVAREWSLFFVRYPILLMPTSWRRPVPIDMDLKGAALGAELIAAQSPLTPTALLGLPGLAVPTGLAEGLPSGVQLVADRFREDLLLRAGEVIEAAYPALGFPPLDPTAVRS